MEVLIHKACKFAAGVFSLFLFLGVQFVCVLFVCCFRETYLMVKLSTLQHQAWPGVLSSRDG